MQEKSFSASYDSIAKIVSVIVVLLFLGVVIASGSVIVAGVEAVLLLLAYAYSPRGYAWFSTGRVVIERLIGNVRLRARQPS